MRKLIIIIICINVCVLGAEAQVIEIDFENRSSPVINFDIDEGDYYKLRISRINLNLYNIILNSTDTLLSKPLQTPTFGSLELDILTKAISGITPLSTSIGLSEELMDLNSTFAIFDIEDPVPSPIALEQNKAKENLTALKDELELIIKRIDVVKIEIYKIRLYALKTENPKSGYDFDKSLKEFEDIRLMLSVLQKKVTVAKQQYEKFSEDNKSGITGEYEKNDKQIKSSYEKLVSAVTEAQSFVNADKVHEFLATIIFIENNMGSTFTSLPIQFRGDQSVITLTIVPRNDKYLLQKYVTKIVFPQNKSYFGTGISLYYSWLYDEAYSTRKVSLNDSQFVYEIVAENYSRNEMGMIALFRYGGKFSVNSLLGGHFSFGPGISISSTLKPRIAIGGGLSLGSKHLISLDAGAIVGFVDKLSNAVFLSGRYKEKPENITVSKLNGAFYFSLGYIYKF